jgi:hypothetical protein
MYSTFNSHIFALHGRSHQQTRMLTPVFNKLNFLVSVKPHPVDHEIKWNLARDMFGRATGIAGTMVNKVTLCAGGAAFIVTKLERLDDFRVLTANKKSG